jgi:phosphatidylinositol alpha-1,6-mannosyltransferase
VVSPGVNAWDADVIGVHMLFDRLAGRSTEEAPARGRLRSWHRRAYFRLVAALEGRVYSGPATVYAVSESDAREIEGRFGRPRGTVRVVPHGVDLERFSPSEVGSRRADARARRGLGDRRVALLVGNEPTVKGMDLAIAALKHLPDDTVLALAGRFDHDQVAEWIDAAGRRDRVVMLEHTSDPIDYFALADVIIAPSRHDSFNLPVLEGLASGLPVVTTDAVGMAELVEGCGDATVIPSPADPDVLGKAIRGALDRGADGSGRRLALELTWERSADRAANIVRSEGRTPRVLVLATGAGRVGGIERITRTLLQALGDAFGDERIGVLSVWRGDRPVRGRVLRRGDAMSADGRVGGARSARFTSDAIRAARRWRRRLAIVATHPHLAPVAWVARAATGAPYAVWCHGIEVWGPLGRATRFGIARADRVFAPSRFTAEQVERWAALGRGSVRVMPHCVPPELAPARGPNDAGRRVPGSVLTVARLEPEHSYKGVDTLIAGWPGVLEAVPGATLTVVGDGADRARLERLADKLEIGSSVTFTGQLSDDGLADRYATASVFALPARHRTGSDAQGEGFGLVFVEAGAAGLPVVAGAGGGADDAVEHDVSGLVVDPRDVEAVGAAVARILTDRSLAERLGGGGRRLAETRFSYEAFRDAAVELVEGMPIRGLIR